MNRKQFIRNIFGAAVAIVIGKTLPVPRDVAPGVGGVPVKLTFEEPWFKQAEAKYMRKWMHDHEMNIWQGSPITHS